MKAANMSGLYGVNVAAITPRGKAGDVNFGATFELIDYLCVAKVGGIALFTAWGEFAAFSGDDRSRLMNLAVKRSRVPILAGVGSATLDLSLALARDARDAGVAALLAPPPICGVYQPEEIREYYLQFAEQLGGGVALFLSDEVSAETALELLETGSFAGIEATGALDLWKGRGVLASEDALFVAARSAGLGVISAAACAAPELTVALDQAIAAGAAERTVQLEAQRQELIAWMAQFPQPVALKTAVAGRGIKTGPLAVPLSAGKLARLEEFKEWFAGWLPATKKLAAHG